MHADGHWTDSTISRRHRPFDRNRFAQCRTADGRVGCDICSAPTAPKAADARPIPDGVRCSASSSLHATAKQSQLAVSASLRHVKRFVDTELAATNRPLLTSSSSTLSTSSSSSSSMNAGRRGNIVRHTDGPSQPACATARYTRSSSEILSST